MLLNHSVGCQAKSSATQAAMTQIQASQTPYSQASACNVAHGRTVCRQATVFEPTPQLQAK